MPFSHGSLVPTIGEDEQSSLFCAEMHSFDKNGNASVTAYAQFTQDPTDISKDTVNPTDDYAAPDTAVK
ncbi:MAG: hypothetical protein GX478_02725 [Erysipelotrichaceae bacterium]|jgi:hypothetical protein|nr:hypothetical protein [Erysipelotrichaceae bacterium]